jgi:hypothetical protein
VILHVGKENYALMQVKEYGLAKFQVMIGPIILWKKLPFSNTLRYGFFYVHLIFLGLEGVHFSDHLIPF